MGVQPEQRSLVVRTLISMVGGLLLAVGFVGLFFPIIPGVVLIASGLALLGCQYHWARKALDKITPARLKKQSPESDTAEAEAA
ncbi:MAG: PGPGW domain-containing protein [Acidimicrobiia bacterium]|nr:PGPGW domain-containing protein [Acidimicrobiia bacterium]